MRLWGVGEAPLQMGHGSRGQRGPAWGPRGFVPSDRESGGRWGWCSLWPLRCREGAHGNGAPGASPGDGDAPGPPGLASARGRCSHLVAGARSQPAGVRVHPWVAGGTRTRHSSAGFHTVGCRGGAITLAVSMLGHRRGRGLLPWPLASRPESLTVQPWP